MSALPHTVLRGVQAVFAIIVLGLSAYVASVVSGSGQVCDFGYCADYNIPVPPQIDYILFCSIWSLLVVIALGVVPIFVSALSHPIISTAVDGLTTIFWFAGAIALAVYTGVFVGDTPSWYQALQAAVAFSFFTWLAFLAALVLDILAIFKGEGARNKEVNTQNPELQQTV